MKRFAALFFLICFLMPVAFAGWLDWLQPQRELIMIPFYPKDANFNSVGIDNNLFVGGTIFTNNLISVNVVDFNILNDANFVNIGVVEGTYLNRVNVVGDANFIAIGISGNAFLLDNVKALFGNAGDLQIYHNGTNSFIDGIIGTMNLRVTDRTGTGGTAAPALSVLGGAGAQGTNVGGAGSTVNLTAGIGGLSIDDEDFGGAGGSIDIDSGDGGDGSGGGNAGHITIDGGSGGAGAEAGPGSDGDIRIQTTGDGDIYLGKDNTNIWLGSSTDLRAYHNGTDSFIENDTGNLTIDNDATGGNIVISVFAFSTGAAGDINLTGGKGADVAGRGHTGSNISIVAGAGGESGEETGGDGGSINIEAGEAAPGAIEDGTSGNINLEVSSTFTDGKITLGDGGTTNYASFSPAGVLTFNGSAYLNATTDSNFSNIGMTGTLFGADHNKTVMLDWYTGNCASASMNTHYGRNCDANTNEYTIWHGYVPDDAIVGSRLSFKLYWMPTVVQPSAFTPTVRWLFYNSVICEGDATVPVAQNYYMETDLAVSEAANTVHKTTFPFKVETGQPGCAVSILVYRRGADAQDDAFGDIFHPLTQELEYISNKP